LYHNLDLICRKTYREKSEAWQALRERRPSQGKKPVSAGEGRAGDMAAATGKEAVLAGPRQAGENGGGI